MRQLLEEQADKLEVAVGAKKSTDRDLRRSTSSLQEASDKIQVGSLPLPSAMWLCWRLSVATCCLLLFAMSSYIAADQNSLVYGTHSTLIAVAVMLTVVHRSKSQWCAVLNLQ